MKPKRKTKPALWTQVPGAKPVVSADRAEFSHGPRLAGKPVKAMVPKNWTSLPKAVKEAKARLRLKAVSTARAKQLRQYAKLKREWMMRNGKKCRHCHMPGKIDLHHARGRIAGLLLRTEFWIPLCRACHARVKEDPQWAYANGLLAPRGLYNSVPKP